MSFDKVGVYKVPGPHFGPPGLTYDCKGVEQDDLQSALDEGWHLSLQDAIAEFLAGDDVAHQGEDGDIPLDDQAPPSRDEMEQQAQVLGLKVDRRWSDVTLLKKIENAMAEADSAS